MWRVEVTRPAALAQKAVLFEGPKVTIGRSDDNDIVLPESHVSRQHARLVEENDASVVEDFGSANGTYVRKGDYFRRVQARSVLPPHATLRIGTDVTVEIDTFRTPGTTVIGPAGGLSAAESSVRNIRQFAKEQAILVLDLCESSRMASRNEMMAFHLKTRLQMITDAVLAGLAVDFYKSTGDGFLATFGNIGEALEAAKEIRARIRKRNSISRNPPINIRMALHVGKTYVVNESTGDIHGSDVNMAFRLESVQSDAFLAKPQQLPKKDRILCSRAFVERLAPTPAADDFVACGQACLKGFRQPVEVFRLKSD